MATPSLYPQFMLASEGTGGPVTLNLVAIDDIVLDMADPEVEVEPDIIIETDPDVTVEVEPDTDIETC